MNDRVATGAGVFQGSASKHGVDEIYEGGGGQVWQAVQHILASEAFAKAPRMRQLLSFLMKKKMDGAEHLINEYAIGLEVFRRDALLYDTCLDPVVRVQAGRLRERLESYYAALSAPLPIRIALPAGSYIPVVTQAAPCAYAPAKRKLQLAPLRNLTCEAVSNTFVSGLEEELGSRLFQSLGNEVDFLSADHMARYEEASASPISQRLEGSIRVEQQHVRASMRLINANAGKIAWLSQFDCSGDLGMFLQEKLALAICSQLQGYFGATPQPSEAR
jgi:TolB-like protein